MAGPKSIGSTWLHLYKGKPWPVVLCDDETPPRAFIEARPNPFLCPAILLGKHIFIFVRVNDLTPFEPGHDYCSGLPAFDTDEPVHTDSEHIKEEKLRRKALTEDAMHFESHIFWKNYIMTKSAARKHEIEMRANRKRSIAEHFIVTGGARPPNRSKKHRRSDNDRQLLTPDPSPRKSSSGVMKSVEIVDPSDEEESEVDRLEKLRQQNIQKVKDNIPPIDHCTIFVGTECTPFTVNRIAMGKCNLLTDWETYTDELGSHINLYEQVDIQKDRFEPIGDYLRRGDFAPHFKKTIATDQFEDAIFMPEHRDEAAQRIAMAYHAAARIQFDDVQKVCMRKLRLLDSLTPNSILLVARVVHMTEKYGAEVEDVMLEWLAEQMSRQFCKLVESANMTLARVIREDVVLSKKVFEKLAKDPTGGNEGLDDE